MKRTLLASAALVVLLAHQAFAATPAYLDPTQPIDKRVDDLIGRMTLPEKAAQLVNVAPAIPRLGVPAYDWWSEGLHGVAATHAMATVFPEPIGLAASFDPAMLHRIGQDVALEAHQNYEIAIAEGRHDVMEGDTLYTPNINIFRDPRWGRGQETYGEDPYLTGTMGVSYITGIQGNDPNHMIASATAKHFAAYSGPEPGRQEFNAVVSAHDAEDTYFPAFRRAVMDAHVASVMCSYNAVNGVPACANDDLLQTHLRGDWKFQGFVASDCDAVDKIATGHHYAKNLPEAAAMAIKAGVDSECSAMADFAGIGEAQKYVDAVKKGLLTEADIDQALHRSFHVRFALGQFDPAANNVALKITYPENLSTPEHDRLALQAARESMVLLKNNGILPIENSPRTIAVIGPLANQTAVMSGNYNGRPPHAMSVLEGIQRQFPNAKILFEEGAAFPVSTTLVPTSALTTPDGKPGLRQEFFAQPNPGGTPILTGTVASVNFAQDDVKVPTNSDVYSVRWSGFLTAPMTADYQLGLRGANNILSLDGKVILDETKTAHAQETRTVPVSLVAGRRYAITLDAQYVGVENAALIWRQVKPDAEARAVTIARTADLVIAAVGINSSLESEESTLDIPGFKGGDRTTINLPAQEEDLLKAVKATGKPLVVVLMNGSALAVNWAQANADAIVEAWYPGQDGGTAIAETLAGVNNPAGRLPVTFYASDAQLPAIGDYSMANRTYRYFKGTPLYPFGYGLSYSTFAYRNLRLSQQHLTAGQGLRATVQVENTSNREGDEVVELFVQPPALPGAPLRALRGFARISLQPHQVKTASFTLDAADFSRVDPNGIRRVSPGNYRISVGSGLSQPVSIAGEIQKMVQGGEAELHAR